MAITSRALAFASRWFDPQTVTRVFDPLVADWQREWLDAPRSKRLIAHVKGLLSFLIAAIVSTPAIFRAQAPQSLTDRIARRIAISTLVAAAVVMLPLTREVQRWWVAGFLVLFQIPGALTFAFPFAMVAAVDAIRTFNGLEAHVARATAAKLAALAVVFMIVSTGWVMPAADQAWRKARTPHQQATGPAFFQEFTTFKLITSPELLTKEGPGSYDFETARMIQRELNRRAALAALPILLLWRRWRALDLPAGRWFSARHTAAATMAMIFAFLMLRFSNRLIEQVWQLPAGIGPWITLALLATIGMIRVALAERALNPSSTNRPLAPTQ